MGIVTSPGSPQAVIGANGGKVYAYANISNVAARAVAPANPSRIQITFHNPGTISIYVAPTVIQNTIGTAPTFPVSNVTLTPTTSALGGCFLIVAGATLTITGECQGAWQALSASATTNPMTVIDSNLG